MRQSVREQLFAFLSKFDSFINHLYLTKWGTIAVGYGLELEPTTKATEYTFVRLNGGETAHENEVSRDVVMLKRNRALAHHPPSRCASFTMLRVPDDQWQKMCLAQAEQNEKHYLEHPVLKWDEFPADVQLALLSMAQVNQTRALGPSPELVKAITEDAWALAAEHCFYPTTEHPNLVPRNWAHRKLFAAAAKPGNNPETVNGFE